jgi:CBS domain-containing protein
VSQDRLDAVQSDRGKPSNTFARPEARPVGMIQFVETADDGSGPPLMRRMRSGGMLQNMDSPLGQLRVADAMHPGLISCPLDTTLRTVARMMSTYRVHAILVTAHSDEELPGGGRWGIVTITDLLRAAETCDLDEEVARTIAATPALSVDTGDSLARAAQLVVEHDVSHLIVLEPSSGRPAGVLSTLDIARALAGLPGRPPPEWPA